MFIWQFLTKKSTFNRVIIYQKNQHEISSLMVPRVFRLNQNSIRFGQKTRNKYNKILILARKIQNILHNWHNRRIWTTKEDSWRHLDHFEKKYILIMSTRTHFMPFWSCHHILLIFYCYCLFILLKFRKSPNTLSKNLSFNIVYILRHNIAISSLEIKLAKKSDLLLWSHLIIFFLFWWEKVHIMMANF